jgi:hypothetical protein
MPFPDSEYPSILRGRDKRESQRLLNAAPDMLAALKMCMELETTCDGRRPCYCDDPEIAKHGKCYTCMMQAAIAKAEGRDG